MVLRRASEYNATRSSLANESELLDFLHTKGLPVARVLMAERDPGKLGGEFIVLERLPGKPHTAAEIGARGRAVMLEMAAILARLHAIDPRELSKPYRADHGVGPAMQSLIERFYSRWQAERVDGSMVLESGFAWLRSNAALLDDRVSIVHGDCNLRNVLVDNGRVSALLDWELAHAGHAAEDLAYIRPDVEAIMPWGEFLDAYAAAGGRPVARARCGISTCGATSGVRAWPRASTAPSYAASTTASYSVRLRSTSTTRPSTRLHPTW